MTHYEVLGVSQSAPAEVIHAAFKALMKVYHPDNGTAKDAKKATQVNGAYAVLKDPAKRAEYDLALNEPVRSKRKVRDPRGASPEGAYPPAYPGMTGEQIQASMDEMVTDMGATFVRHVVKTMPKPMQDIIREALKGNQK